jgi:hypothetical protein
VSGTNGLKLSGSLAGTPVFSAPKMRFRHATMPYLHVIRDSHLFLAFLVFWWLPGFAHSHIESSYTYPCTLVPPLSVTVISSQLPTLTYA